MGRFFNSKVNAFQDVLNSKIYIDKTGLLEYTNSVIDTTSKFICNSRPRRFGKTLNMSMLRSFFETDADASLFDGLYISEKKELCDKYMGKHPVLFLSLKNVEGLTYEDAKYRITELIGIEAQHFSFLASSDRLSDNEKEQYKAIIALQQGRYSMDEKILISSTCNSWNRYPLALSGCLQLLLNEVLFPCSALPDNG